MAEALQLDACKLLASSRKAWLPDPHKVDLLAQFNVPYGSMRVNAYIAWEGSSRKAWAFDTGTQAEPILSLLSEEGLSLEGIFLTHTHPDHVECLDELKRKTGSPPVYVHELEEFPNANLIREGFSCNCATMSLEALHTHGHSAGGTTYLLAGLEKPVAIVGDALFAGSMGGGMVSYEDALRNNREKIMSLPEDTVLCPGHGPMTSVREEKAHNPFFPEF